MKNRHFRGAVAPIALAVLLASSAALAQDRHYSSDWGNPDRQVQVPATPGRAADLDAIIGELKSLTREAERRRAADPNFIADLKALARRYSWPWNRLVVQDDFRDGDLSNNPAWTISAGSFDVRNGGLVGTAERHDQNRSDQPRRQSGDDIAQQLLGGLLRDIARRKQPDSNEPVYNRPESARIYLKKPIPNRFAIQLTMLSLNSPGGRFEFGVGQGEAAAGYYLRYNAGASPALSLVKKTARGRAVIDAVTEPLSLEDGRPHTLLVTRDKTGDMTVTVDGKVRLRVRDQSFRSPFDRFVIINRGGAYTTRSVAIHGAT